MTLAPETPGDQADFSDEPDLPPPPPGPTLGDELTRKRENVRGWLAGSLIALLVALETGLVILAAQKVHPFDRDLFALLLTGLLNPVVALVGTVLGFYFGEKAAEK